MYLDYTQIAFDKFGRPEPPTLLLQTADERTIGTLPNVANLKITVNFSETSEISFDLPAYSDGVPTPLYDKVVGYKVIRTEHYGIFLLMKPEISGDGIEEIKSVTGYSLEKKLENKQFFLEEGTFNFWNPATPDDTILGRILEVSPGWKAGYVAPSLIGRYRTFDQYDDYALSFLYDDAMDTFRCVVVFDVYNKTINAYDADDDVSTLPIYLGFDNLVTDLDITELTDELVTAMTPSGADDLDIRQVNPTGTNWIYDISYFIENGDIPSALAEKWTEWQKSVLNRQEYYKGLVGLRASATARLLSEQAKLVDRKSELDDLTNQQSVTIQALALETTADGKASQQKKLDEINANMEKKKKEVADQEAVVADIKTTLDASNPDSYPAQIKAVNDELKLTAFFTADEYALLRHYFIEQPLSDDTFVASDVDTAVTGESSKVTNGAIAISNSTIAQVDFGEIKKKMYTIAGGTAVVTAANKMSVSIIRGTLEHKAGDEFVLSLYCGEMKIGEKTAPSGLITLTGTLSNLKNDIHEVNDKEVITYEGTSLSFDITAADLYMTTNVSDYQKYSVEMELYDHAVKTLADVASPTYEFSVETGNFIWAQEFEPFRKGLELGKGVYLRLHNDEVITPVLIGFDLDFEDQEKLSLTFSNRFKRHDNVANLKEMIENSYSSSRSFDAAKYTYNQTANQASKVSEFMNSSLDAAVNSIIGAKNQSVRIDGAGLHIGEPDSPYQIRIINGMIAMSDDGFQSAKVAIGHFATDELGDHWGVNADIIGGKLLIGNGLVIEAPNDDGVMQFKVDATGAWLYNSTFVLAKDGGGKILIDPRYGIASGKGDLYTTNGTTVTPSFIDEDGKIVFDDDITLKGLKIPKGTNFYIDANDGKAYFRGNIYAEDGIFNGTVYAKDGEFTGKITATSGEFSGELKGASGTFSGTLKAGRIDGGMISGTIKSDEKTGGALEGVSLNIGNGAFQVDSSGNVTIKSGNISWGAVTGTDEIDQKIENAQSTANSAVTKANSAQNRADDAMSTAEGAADDVLALAKGQYSAPKATFIDGTSIKSPKIYGGEFYGNTFNVISESNGNGSFSLYGMYNNKQYHMFEISYYPSDYPEVTLMSPAGARIVIGKEGSSNEIVFYGDVDFSSATVTGLANTATFG
ncbi:hypothetical protein DW088_01545 [Butyricicoccus sp. AM05-1]|uniref:alanine-zipper protein n=1 Tax=Butyricicoccus sp. AM05-1 TaxID=2292004 RepID=UPI000E4BF099|nr:alanine-zipper protein [Butyricicoccus sp. AM05-1]RHO64915.1 hypothetical protein DW088_01545 [Butyricicoccus sp. AM05-1]